MSETSGHENSFEQLLQSVNQDIYEQFREAVAIGRWNNGETLTESQKALCIQAIIAYEDKHLPKNQRLDFMISNGGCSKQRGKP